MKNTLTIDKFRSRSISTVLCLALTLLPQLCFADLQGSLDNIKFQLTHLILPTLGFSKMLCYREDCQRSKTVENWSLRLETNVNDLIKETLF